MSRDLDNINQAFVGGAWVTFDSEPPIRSQPQQSVRFSPNVSYIPAPPGRSSPTPFLNDFNEGIPNPQGYTYEPNESYYRSPQPMTPVPQQYEFQEFSPDYSMRLTREPTPWPTEPSPQHWPRVSELVHHFDRGLPTQRVQFGESAPMPIQDQWPSQSFRDNINASTRDTPEMFGPDRVASEPCHWDALIFHPYQSERSHGHRQSYQPDNLVETSQPPLQSRKREREEAAETGDNSVVVDLSGSSMSRRSMPAQSTRGNPNKRGRTGNAESTPPRVEYSPPPPRPDFRQMYGPEQEVSQTPNRLRQPPMAALDVVNFDHYSPARIASRRPEARVEPQQPIRNQLRHWSEVMATREFDADDEV